MNAWMQLRLSRGEEPEDLWKHRLTLTDLAKKDGIEIPPENVIEELHSGEYLAKRPAFAAALKLWEQLPPGAGGVLYVADVDRVSRGRLSERGRIQDAMIRADIKVRTPAGWTDLRNPDELLLHEVRGSLAHHYLGKYKERVDKARVAMAKAGKIRTGKVPYGWEWSKDHGVVVVPEEFAVVQAICHEIRFASTYKLSEKYGLCQVRICHLLRNPFICGYPAKRWFPNQGQRPWKTSSYPSRDPEQWIWPEVPADYPAACTLEEWEDIQRILQDRFSRKSKEIRVEGWCRDVVRFRGEEKKVGVGLINYRYPAYQLIRPNKPRLYVPRQHVHEVATRLILAVLARPVVIREALEIVRAERLKPEAVDAVDLTRKLEKLNDAMASLRVDEKLAEPSELPSIRKAQEKVKQQIQSTTALLKECQRRQPLTGTEQFLGAFPTENAPKIWEEVDDTERRLFANGFLERLEVVCEPVAGQRGWRREVDRAEYVWPLSEIMSK